ncbi:hypothetical protein M0R45_002888 [Rubus argutus]|uniref:Ankyrin repeat protein SKIP35 n=1 Tax=Rubus argutus TaxID=59490 RepID=A0AAW1YDQ4_RUBAR
MDMEAEESGIDGPRNGLQGFTIRQRGRKYVVFSREGPLVRKDSRMSTTCSCSTKKLKSRVAMMDSQPGEEREPGQEKKLSRQDRIELGRLFQSASRTMSLADTVTLMAQRLHERLQECNGDEVLKAEAGAKLSAFKTFLDIAGTSYLGRTSQRPSMPACFPLTLFSSSFYPGWASGISATAIQGLLGMLVEGGADNVNQCFLEASRFGSTELVRILLQIAQRNSLDVDVDLALGFASHYCKIGTMECLVEEGNAIAFLGPLMRAAERGCMQVVEWFVKRGCRDMELCLALTAATSSSQVGVAAYLLPHVPHHVLAALSIEILKAAGERSGGSLGGVAFLLHSDFLGDPAATYAVADNIARSDDEGVAHELRAFLREHWSEEAFLDGRRQEQEHYMNLVRILKWGGSPICLRDLPAPLRITIAYLPLYRECVKAGVSQCKELLAFLEHHLPPFLLHPPCIV